jgi:hypothetical protein
LSALRVFSLVFLFLYYKLDRCCRCMDNSSVSLTIIPRHLICSQILLQHFRTLMLTMESFACTLLTRYLYIPMNLRYYHCSGAVRNVLRATIRPFHMASTDISHPAKKLRMSKVCRQVPKSFADADLFSSSLERTTALFIVMKHSQCTCCDSQKLIGMQVLACY